MKIVAAIFLLVLVSIQTPIGQLFKIPLFVEHFIKHQKNQPSLLIGFIAEHYSAGHQDADLPEDEQLPFKNIHYFSLVNAIVPAAGSLNFIVPHGPEKKEAILCQYSPQRHLSNIFHPPRACC